MFDPDQIQLPPTVGKWCPDQSPLQLMHAPGQLGAGVPQDCWPRTWAAYLGMVAMIDACFGRIIDELRFWQLGYMKLPMHSNKKQV